MTLGAHNPPAASPYLLIRLRVGYWCGPATKWQQGRNERGTSGAAPGIRSCAHVKAGGAVLHRTVFDGSHGGWSLARYSSHRRRRFFEACERKLAWLVCCCRWRALLNYLWHRSLWGYFVMRRLLLNCMAVRAPQWSVSQLTNYTKTSHHVRSWQAEIFCHIILSPVCDPGACCRADCSMRSLAISIPH